jgi:hypothetical protein
MLQAYVFGFYSFFCVVLLSAVGSSSVLLCLVCYSFYEAVGISDFIVYDRMIDE